MLNLILPIEQQQLLLKTLRKAGRREIGGMLFGEQAETDLFFVRSITVHPQGAFASFIRRIEDAMGGVRDFFQQTGHDYRRFNYLGEWHSHPSFAPYPSKADDFSMRQIVQDESVGATFAVLLITKLGLDGELVCTVHTYLPNGDRMLSSVNLETD